MKAKIVLIFSLILILSVAEYNLYRKMRRVPASEVQSVQPEMDEKLPCKDGRHCSDGSCAEDNSTEDHCPSSK